MSIRTLVPALALALVIACGDDGENDDLRFGPEGVWRGEASAERSSGRPIDLCLEIEDFDTTAPPERFSGALHVDGRREELISGTWGPGDSVAFSTERGEYTGSIAVERLFGTWRTPVGPATPSFGGWTLDRTDDSSCESAGSTPLPK